MYLVKSNTLSETHMKTAIRSIALALSIAIITLTAAACSIKGNTYAYGDVEIVYTRSAESTDPPLRSNEIALAKSILYDSFKDSSLTFNADGTVTYGTGDKGNGNYWKQKGSRIYLGFSKDFEIKNSSDNYLEMSGKDLVFSVKYSDEITAKIIYTLTEKI